MLDNLEDIHYLCFGGGGGYGMMFRGALEALVRKRKFNINEIKGCIGTSAGALIAFAVASGVSYDRFLKLSLEYDHFNVAPKMDVALLVNHYGMDEGSKLMEVIEATVEAAGMAKCITFSDLYRLTNKHFVCVVSNLDTQEAVYLDHNSNPDMEVKLAIRISMGLPLIFPPYVIDETYYVDGGITNNYPIDFFPIENTLIFCIRHENKSVRTWKEYGISVIDCGLTAQKNNFIQRLKDMNMESRVIELHTPAYDIKLTEIRRDVAVYGFYCMLLKLCPETLVAIEKILLFTIMRFVKILGTIEDTPLYSEVDFECETQSLEE